MAAIPCYCENCGTIFEFNGIGGSNIRGLTLRGNRVSCPNCYSLAKMADGVFNVTDGVLNLISGSDFTAGLMQRFGDLIKRAYEENASPEALQEQANELDPRLGKVIAEARKSGGIFWFVMAALMVFLTHCSFQIEAKVDVNRLMDQLIGHTTEEVMEGWTPSVHREDAKNEDNR